MWSGAGGAGGGVALDGGVGDGMRASLASVWRRLISDLSRFRSFAHSGLCCRAIVFHGLTPRGYRLSPLPGFSLRAAMGRLICRQWPAGGRKTRRGRARGDTSAGWTSRRPGIRYLTRPMFIRRDWRWNCFINEVLGGARGHPDSSSRFMVQASFVLRRPPGHFAKIPLFPERYNLRVPRWKSVCAPPIHVESSRARPWHRCRTRLE
jgi:hypothetical protein